jgi:hypothetical protein
VGQNETAAQCFAGKHTVYMKYIHEEVEQKEHPPVAVLGDNDQATNFSQEDMITSGNKYYYLPCSCGVLGTPFPNPITIEGSFL